MTDHIAESFRRPPPTRMDVMLACETLIRAGHTQEANAVLFDLMSDEAKDMIRKAWAA